MGRKKPTLKSSVNRGFATTSIPKKASAPSSGNASPAPGTPVSKPHSASIDYEQVNNESLAGNLAGEHEGQEKDQFDPQKEEEQALQNLVNKVQERVDKEVSRQHKAIEYDRRFSKTLPNFDMEPQLRDQVLEVAAALQKPTSGPKPAQGDSNADADTLAPSSQPESSAASPSASALTSASTTTPATTASGTITPLSLGPPRTSVAMASLSKDLQHLALSNPAASSSSAAFADTEEKVMAKCMTTYQLLLKLGFSAAYAESAIAGAASPELEDCLSYLFLTLDEDNLEDALRTGEGKALKNRKGKSSGKTQDVMEETEEDEDYDESRPPVYSGYEFQRSEALGKTDFARNGTGSSKSVPGSAGPQSQDAGPSTPSKAAKPAEPSVKVSKEKLEGLKKASEKLVLHLNDDLESEQIETLERPTATWSLLRAMQIRIDQERSRWKKELGKDAESIMKNEDGRLERVYGRTKDFMRECERGAFFDQKTATDGFRQVLRQREEIEKQLKAAEEQEEQKRQQRRKEINAAAGIKDETPPEPSPAPTTQPADPAKEKGDETTGAQESANNSDDEDDAKSDAGSDGGMFGDLLNEGPVEDTDAETGVTVTLRNLPTQAKSGGGGKTPRVMLSDALKRADAYSSYKFTKILSGGRLHRSKLTIRWNGGKVVPNKHPSNAGAPTYVDEYTLTTVGCATQLQADDFVATIALFCIDKDKPVQRALPPGFRDWWDELTELQKEEKDGKSRSRYQRVRDVVRVRMEEAGGAKKPKAKAQAGPAAAQTELGELSSASVRPPSEAKAKEITEYITNRIKTPLYQKMLPGRQNLPIAKHRQEILDLIQNNQIFVLSGETGCGKSTQVPAYILEDAMSRGQNCKIYVTEPRRISAISLAERVSEELGEPRKSVGGSDSLVGYAIRLESHVGKNARLVYATTGIVLRMLEGTAFNEITHVIIDEVHERSIESDFLLIILKTLIAHRKDLKVILMSATVDAERISAYCGGCPTISVPGRTFPVNVHYLEDAVEMSDYIIEDESPYLFKPKRGWNTRKQDAPGNRSKLQLIAQPTEEDDDPPTMDDDDDEQGPAGAFGKDADGKTYRTKTIDTLSRMNEYIINHDLIIKVLERVCMSGDLEAYSAATLIFMPGLAEIRKCHDLLADHPLFGGAGFQLFPLHSTISSENQGAVFDAPPPGVRKIVIATNIAETGITIPDITCVIDSGKHREMRYDEKRQISRLVECFIARSNAKQRRGRAGRVQEGICFHLFTRLRHDSYLDEHPLPEMLRLSLQDLALKLKVMKIKIGSSIEDALTQALDPPSSANIQRAISALVEVKALTTLEEITHLGRHLSKLPLDVHMGKFLLVATLFKCLDPALTIAAALNSKSPFITPFGKEAEADRAKQSFKLGDSDFLTIANAFNGFRRSTVKSHHKVFCAKSFLSLQNLMQIEELRQQYFAYLIDAGFVTVDDTVRQEVNKLRYRGGNNYGKPRFLSIPAELNVNSGSLSMIHATLATGLYPKLLQIDGKSYQLKTVGNNQPTSIHPSSVNFKAKMGDLIRSNCSYMLYYTMMQSKRLYAWETGLMDDKAVYMLCGDAEFKPSSNSLYIDRQRIRIACQDPKSLLALKTLREQLTKLMNASFRNPGKQWTDEQARLFDLACQVLGVGANDKDLALQQ